MSGKQFSNYVKSVKSKRELFPQACFMKFLERRLDNVVYRLGLASSRPLSRQLVSHGHITVNGRKVTVPSYRVSVGDIIAIREGSLNIVPFKDLKDRLGKRTMPAWIKFNIDEVKAEIGGNPTDSDLTFNLNSVIEFYSR